MTIKSWHRADFLMESSSMIWVRVFTVNKWRLKSVLSIPKHSGKLERSAFIEWYVKLCESGETKMATALHQTPNDRAGDEERGNAQCLPGISRRRRDGPAIDGSAFNEVIGGH
jgi:hypothetical protein